MLLHDKVHNFDNDQKKIKHYKKNFFKLTSFVITVV